MGLMGLIHSYSHTPTIISHSKRLKFGLFTEDVFPRRERRPASVKYEVVSLLLNMPGSKVALLFWIRLVAGVK